MGREFNPQAPEFTDKKESVYIRSTGKKLVAAVGFRRSKSQNNNDKIEVRVTCLEVIEGDKSDRNKDMFVSVTLADNIMWKVAQFINAINPNSGPFDLDSDEAWKKILFSSPFVAHVIEDDYRREPGKVKLKAEDFSSWDKEENPKKPEWGTFLKEGKQRYLEGEERRKENEGKPRNSSSGGGNRGGGNKSGGGRKNDEDVYRDDDIPF